jgi:electron transport complex protein RnfG
VTPALRETATTGLALLVFAVVGAALLSGTYLLTRPTIEKSEQAEKLAFVAQTLPAGSFDNDLIRDARPLPADPLLGLKRPGQAYLARLRGETRAVVLEAVAPDGYSGEIRLLVGIQADGRLAGVRVTAHKETPGLGDYIELARSAWIRQFDGRGLDDPPAEQWRVKKDGGRFDYRAGATITPRAVVKAVRRALEYFAAHRAELLASTPTPPASVATPEAKP